MNFGENGYIGNSALISTKEEAMAEMLRNKNFENANETAKEVHPQNSFYTRYGKRMLDFCIALIACFVLAPFNIIFAICTYFDVGNPVLYKQSRCGLNGESFILYKFRNMNEKKDKDGKLLPASQRVTKFGKIMRKYSLDELLNFVSVLKGDMSLIGPRPLPMFFYDRMNKRHQMRTAVRPGLECPRILTFDEANLCQYHMQFENDIWYVEHVSFLIDLKMCFLLVKMVFDMKVRGNRARADVASYFVGYDEYGHALSMNTAKELYKEFYEELDKGE